MEGHQGVFQFGEFLGAVRGDPFPYQLFSRPGEREVRLAGDGRPLRMARPRPRMPLAVDPRESFRRGMEPCDGNRPGRGHVDVEDPREGGLSGEETQERPAASAQRLLGGRVLGHRTGCGPHLAEQQLAALAGRGQEAVVLAVEVHVERGA